MLDRINPLGGKVEGGLLQPGFESFVGAYPLTTRYGLTPGEFARLANEEQHIGCQLHVLPGAGLETGDALSRNRAVLDDAQPGHSQL